ncbi:MAG: MarC family protein [Verrucomicrobiales bacterium]|nr:MarC family protein [Verrucomicrobiales bacterium]
MNPDFIFFGTVFAAFFAIMNPLANTPVFLGLTEGMDGRTTRQLALNSLILTFIIVSVFALLGNAVLNFFGITLYAFKVAGGILVGLVGYNLLHGNHSSVQKPSDEHLEKSGDATLGMAVSPLAMPILAGPGTLVTAMNYAADGGFKHLLAVILSFSLVCLMTFFCFVSGNVVTKFLGQNFIMVISRIMGLILAVIGIQMLIDGIRAAVAATG